MAYSRTIPAILVVMLLCASCSFTDDARVAVEAERVFAPVQDLALTGGKIRCDSAAAVYFETVALRNMNVVEDLESADPDTDVELRVGLIRNVAWSDVAPSPDLDLRVVGVGTAIDTPGGLLFFEAQDAELDGDPPALLAEQIADPLAVAQLSVDRQEKILQAAVDAGNQFMVKRRSGDLKDLVAERDRLAQMLAEARRSGPEVSTLSLFGRPPALSGYLNGIGENLVYDAIVTRQLEVRSDVETAMTPLFLVEWGSSFFDPWSSVIELESVFSQTAMLPMLIQLEASQIEAPCGIP